MAASSTPRKSAPRKAVQKPKASEEFAWTLDSGQTIVFPPMNLTYGLIEDMSEMDVLQQTVAILKAHLSDEDRKLLRPLDYGELKEIMEAWGEHSGATLGE